ncbi:glycosyltransferase family 4 protein [Mangrovimonas aestuarii]|uniref:glycosyltransferase family 4 protein n=1 Tax=Mangrovimonas aestuarii TaxID=3018443 RepID=UPI002379F608|nr:glycosyltransferase family 4 protein [Mangrovimonas aestuarii]
MNFLLKGQLKFFRENGFDVYAASSKSTSKNYKDEVKDLTEREGIPHYVIPFTRKLNPLFDLYSLFCTIKLILKLKPDVVHTHSPKAGVVGMLAARLCGVPLKIHTVAGLPLMEEKGFTKKLLITVEKLTYTLADYVLPNSKNLQSYIINNIYNDKKKIFLIGNGSSNGIDLEYYNKKSVPLEILKQCKEKYDIRDTDIVLSYVGRLAHYKGVNELIEAFVELQNKIGNLKLLLIGAIEEINPLKEDNLKQINENYSIISTGQQKDIRPFLAVSDIFVFPSYREGFPQSLMQAAAFNIPCIATNINGCNEIIEDGKSGFLIPVKNVQGITDTCELLINNKNLRDEVAKNSRKKLEMDFEQTRLWKHLLKFYNQALT